LMVCDSPSQTKEARGLSPRPGRFSTDECLLTPGPSHFRDDRDCGRHLPLPPDRRIARKTHPADPAMTPLDKPLKREVRIGEDAYSLTIDPDGLKLVPKGKRKGLELRWTDLVSGDAALATALQASLEAP